MLHTLILLLLMTGAASVVASCFVWPRDENYRGALRDTGVAHLFYVLTIAGFQLAR